MIKQSLNRIVNLLLILVLFSSCSPSLYPNNQYLMEESFLLMLSARMNLLDEDTLITEMNSNTAKLMKPVMQTQQEKINQLRLLADYYRYYDQKYGKQNAELSNALKIKSDELRDQADILERRMRRVGFFRQAGRALGRVVCFVMDRVGERVEVLVEENIRETINSVVISPRRLAQQQITLGWHRLLGPLGGSAASIIRAELFPQLDRARERLMAESNRLPDPGNELADSILNSNSPRSDRLPNAEPPKENNQRSMFESFSQTPDHVKISLWGPIPAMDVVHKNGQIGPGHDAIWYFEPQDIPKFNMAIMMDNETQKMTGNLSGSALYEYNDSDLAFYHGQADIIGKIIPGEYQTTTDQNSTSISVPIEIKFSGSVHEANQFSTSTQDPNGPGIVPRYIVFIAYQDVDFEVTVLGTLKLISNDDGTASMEIQVTNCENSSFYSPSEGALLSNCSVHLIWNELPD